MRTQIQTICKRAAAASVAAAGTLALGTSSALAAAGSTATGAAAGGGGATSGGTSLTTVAQNAGTTVHTLTLVGIGIALAITALIGVFLHKPKVLLVGICVAIGAFFFVNGGAANVANNTASGLANGSAQSSGASTGSAGIPGVNVP
jgi:hypothetical protein